MPIATILWLCSFCASFLILPIPDVLGVAISITCLLMALGILIVRKFPTSFLTLALSGLMVISAVSVVASEVKLTSLTYCFFLLVLPLSFVVGLSIQRDKALSFIRCFIFILSLSSLYQFYFMPEMLRAGVYWPFIDNNSLACVLGVGFLLWLGKAFSDSQYSRYYLLGTLIVFAGLMTTGGLAVFMMLIVIALVTLYILRPVPLKKCLILTGGVLCLMLVMVKSDLSFQHFIYRAPIVSENVFQKGLAEDNYLSGSRSLLWKSAYQIFLDNPLTGTGIGTFYLYYPEYRNPVDDSAGYVVHNDLLQFGVEMGFLAPFLALLMVAYICYRTFKKIRAISDKNRRIDFFIPFAAFGLVVSHSLVNFNFYVLPTLVILGFLLSVWQREVGYISKSIVPSTGYGLSLLVLASIIPLWAVSLSEYYTVRATDSLQSGRIEDFADELNEANIWGLGYHGHALFLAGQLAYATGETDKALALLKQAEEVNPRLDKIYQERAHIFYQQKNYHTALNEINVAFKLDPASLETRMQLSDILVALGRDNEAYDVLKGGLAGRIKHHDPRPFYRKLSEMAGRFKDFATQSDVIHRLKYLENKP
jgi:O-antigen ligase